MSAVRRGTAVACGLSLSLLAGLGMRAQEAPAMAPWAADALDAGCLLRDELAALGGGVNVGSQDIAYTLGMERGEEVVRCLLALSAWRDHVSSLNAGANGTSSLRFGVQARPGVAGSEGGRQAGVVGRWRGPRGMHVRLNASTSTPAPALGCRLSRDAGDVLIGTLSPRIGQGSLFGHWARLMTSAGWKAATAWAPSNPLHRAPAGRLTGSGGRGTAPTGGTPRCGPWPVGSGRVTGGPRRSVEGAGEAGPDGCFGSCRSHRGAGAACSVAMAASSPTGGVCGGAQRPSGEGCRRGAAS